MPKKEQNKIWSVTVAEETNGWLEGVLKEEKLNQYVIITACGYDLMNSSTCSQGPSYLLKCIMSHVITLTVFQAPVYSIS